MGRASLPFASRNFRGYTAADNGRNILSASATTVLLITPMNERRETGAPIAIKDADAFGTVKTMGGNGDQRGIPFLDIDIHPTGAGDGIDEKQNAAFGKKGADLLQRLNGAD